MLPELRYWKNLKPEQREQIKISHNVKVVTFEFIKKAYLESL